MTSWILLRGLTREARHWGGFVPALRAALPSATVLPIDLPGNGMLWQLRSPSRVEAMAEQVRGQVQALGLRPPYRVLAMSLGAMVATAWAHAHPQELADCVFVNTSLRPFSRFTQRLQPRNYAALLRLVKADDRAWEETVLRLTTRGVAGDAREALLQRWVAWRRERPVSRGNALRQLWAAARYTAPRAAPPARLLVLTAAADGLVDPDCSRELARAWRCDLAEHPWAGHDLPLDDPAWVIAQLLRWDATAPAR